MTIIRNLKWLVIGLGLTVSACTSVPDGIAPVGGFEADRYLGTWYEIARLDHSFERGLSNVSANYDRRDDGGIVVLNRGFKDKSGEWKDATGKAYFVEDSDVGHLKVSFFGPFYGSYIIFELDEDYRYAFIAGNSRDNLWLLSRTPAISDRVRSDFIEQASTLGFAIDDLIWVDQDRNLPRAMR